MEMDILNGHWRLTEATVWKMHWSSASNRRQPTVGQDMEIRSMSHMCRDTTQDGIHLPGCLEISRS